MILSCRDLRKQYGATTALDGASLEIAPGEVVAVMGSSGSGKSTLLHCAAGIIRPDAGEVQYDGRSIGALGDARRSALAEIESLAADAARDIVAKLTGEQVNDKAARKAVAGALSRA